MSVALPNNAVQSFDAIVKHAYQGSGVLRPTVRLKTGVVGSSHRFPKMGKGMATQRVPQTDVVPMNVAHTNSTATISDWNAPEYTDIFNQQKVNYDEQKELGTVIAGAIGRREDQLIIDAADGASTTLTVAKTIGAVDAMNCTKLRSAKRLLDQQGVPAMDRFFVWSAIALEQMLGSTAATSGDYNTVRALVNGELDTFVGFKFKMIEDRSEGGLPLSTNDRTNYAWHKAAMGLAVGIDFRTEINYIAEKTSWLANGLFAAGSVGIDALGIVEITTDESVSVEN